MTIPLSPLSQTINCDNANNNNNNNKQMNNNNSTRNLYFINVFIHCLTTLITIILLYLGIFIIYTFCNYYFDINYFINHYQQMKLGYSYSCKISLNTIETLECELIHKMNLFINKSIIHFLEYLTTIFDFKNLFDILTKTFIINNIIQSIIMEIVNLYSRIYYFIYNSLEPFIFVMVQQPHKVE